jgi:membrane fusion protein, multidrug efflux system
MNVQLRITCLALTGMAILSGCKGKPEEAAKAKPAPSIPGWIARDTVVSRDLIGSGSILADAVVDLRSELAARVESVGFREGQDVRAGQLLVKLASQDIQATRDKARANTDLAKATLERKRQQFSSQSVSQQDVDQAVQALAAAQADLAASQALLAKSEIRSPFAGRVGTSNVAVGQFLSVGQALATVAKIKPLKVEFQVPGDDVAKVRPGMPLLFKPFGKGDFREAKITAADAVLDTLSRTLRVRAAWTGESKGLIPGAAVEIRIPLGKEPVFLLPPQALGSEGKVLVLRGGNATVQKVTVGRRTADAVEVQGLTKGDTVLCNGAVAVKPGSAVKPSRFL